MKRRGALLFAGLLALAALLATFRPDRAPGDPAGAARTALSGGAPAFCDPALAALLARPGAAGQTSGDVRVQVASRSASAAEIRVRGWAADGGGRLDWTVRTERHGGRWCVASVTASPRL